MSVLTGFSSYKIISGTYIPIFGSYITQPGRITWASDMGAFNRLYTDISFSRSSFTEKF